jgi:hypothetical protein
MEGFDAFVTEDEFYDPVYDIIIEDLFMKCYKNNKNE